MTDETTDKDAVFIQSLADMLKSSDLSEIEVERSAGKAGMLKVRLTRHPTPAAFPDIAAAPQPVAPQPAAPTPQPTAVSDEPTKSTAAGTPDLSNAVTSPMVGTVYLAPEPGAEPFVAIGDQVQEGATLLIIEAMKTMNQIPAPRGGTVKRILVEDGAPVEFGAPLMILE